MDIKLFTDLVKWMEEGNRRVTIKMSNDETSVYCWDSDLMTGQNIEKSLDELNLLDREIEHKEQELERLRKIKEGLDG